MSKSKKREESKSQERKAENPLRAPIVATDPAGFYLHAEPVAADEVVTLRRVDREHPSVGAHRERLGEATQRRVIRTDQLAATQLSVHGRVGSQKLPHRRCAWVEVSSCHTATLRRARRASHCER